MRQKSNYKILGLVGTGEFGRVFAAIERTSGILVALKELKARQFPTSSFLRELNFLVTLNHFNIVTCRALEHRQNNRYIVMDYCEGGTLRNLLHNSGRLTLNQSLSLVIDILSGLKFAHDRGIIHRDLKPENILLKVDDRFWTAHISDFGIAKLHQEIKQDVMGDTGSPAYMAPEQFYGQYSYSCDLYAVGIILFELVVGERPFSGMPKELLAAHLNQPVIIPENVPFLLRSAIAKSLQKMPHRRFQNAAQMLASLRLVQTVLEIDPVTQISAAIQSKFLDLTPIELKLFTHPITHLAIAAEQLYLGSGDRLYLQRYQNSSLAGATIDQWSIVLDKPIRNLQFNAQGCFISTAASIYYLPKNTATLEFRFVCQTLLPIATFPTANLISTIDSQGSWLGVSYLPRKSKTSAFEIFKLPNCQLLRSFILKATGTSAFTVQINCQPWNFLIALDSRRGLGIYQNRQQETEFHLFNRRGNWLANFTVQIQLAQIVHNPLFPNQILATQTNHPGVAIKIALDKFTIKRIYFDLAASLITTCPQGYLLSDRQGKIVLVEGDNLNVRHYQIPLSSEFSVTAIAASNSQLLVASASSFQSQLHRFYWQ